MSEPEPQRKRRVRYKGTHPRRFEEKYKELAADKYTDDVDKIIRSGKTPAGTHRPICVSEILEVLAPQPGQTGLDATLGYGGHARELLARIMPGGQLFGIDVDRAELARATARLRALGYDETQLVTRQINFAGIPKLLDQAGGGFDFIVADLGVSSMQLDDPARGFSWKREAPLDLRMNPSRGAPAAALVAKLPEPKLAALLRENADEPKAGTIAAAIVAARAEAPLATTTALARAVLGAVSGPPAREKGSEKETLARVFQALRIAVNDEFTALDTFLAALPSCLRPGGRVAILTFHSGEDRRVKKAFQDGVRKGLYAAAAPEVIRAGAEERRSNPRSTAAKLRWAVRS